MLTGADPFKVWLDVRKSVVFHALSGDVSFSKEGGTFGLKNSWTENVFKELSGSTDFLLKI